MRQLLSWILGKEIAPDATLGLSFNWPLDRAWVLMAVVLIAAFAVWIYRTDGRETASLRLRIFLGVLRAGLIGSALFIICEPILVATQIDTRRSVVIVLVDDSASMGEAFSGASEPLRKKLEDAMAGSTLTLQGEDGGPLTVSAEKMTSEQFKYLTRLDVIQYAMQNKKTGGMPFLDALRKDHDVKFFGFADGISEGSVDPKKSAEGEVDPYKMIVSVKRGGKTRIGDALREALDATRGQPVAGVVIISDGRQNSGVDAVQAASEYKTGNVPIFSVAIGDPSEAKDFEITHDGSPEAILPDDPSETSARIRFKGYADNQTIKVEMKDKNSGRVVDTVDAKLGKAGEITTVKLHFKETQPGPYEYTIHIPEQEGQKHPEKNTVDYKFQVVDKKLKVLFLEGQDLPRWEFRYLKNAMKRDRTTESDVLMATSDGYFLLVGADEKEEKKAILTSKAEISEYDVIIFGDISPSIFTKEQFKLIKDFISEGGGFLMIAGERYAPSEYAQAPWLDILPVVPQRGAAPTPDQESFYIEPTPEGARLPWMQLEPTEQANRDIWEELKKRQMYWYYPIEKKKELATVIAVHPTDKLKTGEKMPLIVEMQLGLGKTMFIGVDSLWRWRRGYGDKYHYRFYNQAIRHLSKAKQLGGQKRFFLGADPAAPTIGDKMKISAQVKNENMEDSTEQSVVIHGKDPKGVNFNLTINASHDSPGSFSGEYIPKMKGNYTIWMTDPSQPELHLSEQSFVVKPSVVETENLQLDEEMLRNIAKAGGDGGGYFQIDELNTIPPKIKPTEKRISHETTFDLWDNWAILTLFTLCITLEWIMRKYGRMI